MKLLKINEEDVINTDQICRIKQVNNHIAVMLADGTKLSILDMNIDNFIKSLTKSKTPTVKMKFNNLTGN